jgi:hypothetical protein
MFLQCRPIERVDFQIAVWKNQVRCTKRKTYGESIVKYHLIYDFYFLKINLLVVLLAKHNLLAPSVRYVYVQIKWSR